jgi:tetratricopeptide (TPR) repeat protein
VDRIRRFISEVGRRRVLATTALYIVAAWVAIQVADLSIEAGLLHWPLRAVFVAAFLGFPIALIIAWFYDITRKGIVRTPPVGAPESLDRSLGKKDYVLLASLAAIWVVANVLIYTPAPADRSIAILPFENRGHDPQGADLAFGVRLDLHSQLEMLGDVRIIALSSTDNVDASLPVSAIAEQLGAAYIMKGTVERVLDQFRVSVTLIDASRDERTWSGSWDRQLDLASLFDIRDDLAAGITSNLRAVLSPQEQERLQRRPTANFEAYQLYLLGRQRMAKRSTGALAEAVDYFERAAELDPDFVLAWVGLAESSYLHMLYSSLPENEWLPKIDMATKRTLELDRLSGEAHAILAMLENYRGDDVAAEKAFLRAIELNPGYATAYHWYGSFLSMQDREEEALRLKTQALELDPLSANTHLAVGGSLRALGRFDEALERFLKAIEIDPDVPGSYERVAEINYNVYGRLDEAVVWQMRAIARDEGDMMAPARLGLIYLDLGDPDEAERWFDLAASVVPPGHPAAAGLAEPPEMRRGNLERSAEIGRRSLQLLSPRMPHSLRDVRNYELRAGRFLAARELYERGYPELFAEPPDVGPGNYDVAIDLALVLIHNGEQAHADVLLDRAAEIIQSVPRLGVEGYGIADVHILALRGTPEQAIRALRQAVDAGWRTNWWMYLEHDPAFDSMRGHDGFQAILKEIRIDMETQLAKVRQMQAAGELPPIP